jgi:hypothetical protein
LSYIHTASMYKTMGEEKPEEEPMGKISSLRGSKQHHKNKNVVIVYYVGWEIFLYVRKDKFSLDTIQFFFIFLICMIGYCRSNL